MLNSRRRFLSKLALGIASLPLISRTSWGQRILESGGLSSEVVASFRVVACEIKCGKDTRFSFRIVRDGFRDGVQVDSAWVKDGKNEGILKRDALVQVADTLKARILSSMLEAMPLPEGPYEVIP